MWSVGCIIFELFEGERVFDVSGLTGSIPSHLAMMQRLTGLALPAHMVQRASQELSYCTDRNSGRLMWPEVSGGDLSRDRCVDRELEVLRIVPLSQRINHPQLYQMRDFLSAIMQLDPDRRITPSAAFNCEWCVLQLSPLLSVSVLAVGARRRKAYEVAVRQLNFCALSPTAATCQSRTCSGKTVIRLGTIVHRLGKLMHRLDEIVRRLLRVVHRLALCTDLKKSCTLLKILCADLKKSCANFGNSCIDFRNSYADF
jgi:serine/threonine protein kinase